MFCHENREPVFITKDGQGDLAVMSMESYDMLNGKFELHRLLAEGHKAYLEGRVKPSEEVFAKIKKDIIDGKI
jgi:PHD/YefM family antitoxin component YafN of YafNO toxin-antitoxin module